MLISGWNTLYIYLCLNVIDQKIEYTDSKYVNHIKSEEEPELIC
jgi:hypothetical protein